MGFLTDIGGVYQSIFLIGRIIVSVFIDKLFYSHIMKEMYQVNDSKL